MTNTTRCQGHPTGGLRPAERELVDGVRSRLESWAKNLPFLYFSPLVDNKGLEKVCHGRLFITSAYYR